MIALYIILAALALAAPLAASAAICAPKWAAQSRTMHYIEHRVDMMNETQRFEGFLDFMSRRRAWLAPVRWFWAVPVLIAVAIGLVVYAWFLLWFKVVEQKCPYALAGVTQQDSWNDFNYQHQLRGVYNGLIG